MTKKKKKPKTSQQTKNKQGILELHKECLQKKL